MEGEEGLIYFLPILEEQLIEVKDVLQSGLAAMNFYGDIEKIFPFEGIIALGLKSASKHWIHLAIERASELSASGRLAGSLDEASTSAPTQRLRHEARRLAARMREQLTDETGELFT